MIRIPLLLVNHQWIVKMTDWNGITRWIWDFGDASPQVEGGIAWHQYTMPGSYIVTLTVVDGFEGGETNSTSISLFVSQVS